MKTIVSHALALLLAPILLSACAPPSARDEPTGVVALADTAGVLCASPSGGGNYCVPDTQNPADAWSQAAAHGKVPIQLWAEPPAGLSTDALVGDAGKLKAWFADIDRALSFLEANGQNAESLDASLAGNLGQLVKKARDRQSQIVSTGQSQIAHGTDAFKQAVTAKATAITGPLNAAIMSDTQTIAAVKAVVAKGQQDAQALQAPFTDIAQRFQTYRGTETAILGQWQALSTSASTATLDNYGDLQTQVVTLSRQEGMGPDSVILDASRLLISLRAADATLATALEPYLDFMGNNGMPYPEFTAAAERSLDSMISYCERRRGQTDEITVKLLDGLHARREALIALAADQATRDTLAQARLTEASTQFVSTTTQQISDLWAKGPVSTKLGLPLLAGQYDKFTAFLQLEPLCTTGTASTSWRDAGCASLKQNFSKAHIFVDKTVRGLIKIGLIRLKGQGPSDALLADVQAKLTAGDVKGATLSYDEAVHASDGT